MQDLQAIVEGCIGNSSKCQKTFYERYYGYALKIIFRYIYRYDRATDVVNDGFVKIFKNFHRFEWKNGDDLEKMIMGWIRRILVNTAIDELRKNQMLPEIGDLSEQEWNLQDQSEQADKTLLYKELVSQVKKLPPSYRAVFNMYVIDGFTHLEIAKQLDISVGTSKSNLSKAREHLKKIVNKDFRQAEYAIYK